MKFSVIIPIYKVEQYLGKCLEGVLKQTYPEIEIILVDDGSPDNCPKLCDDYAAKYDRIKVIHKSNGGLSDARNVGLEMASGDYIVFLDSDDYWDNPNAILMATELLNNYPETDVILFQNKHLLRGKIHQQHEKYDIDYINNASVIDTLVYLLKKDIFNYCAHGKFIRRKLLVDNGIMFEKGLLSEDYDWNFKLISHIKSLKALSDPFYVYRRREGSISTSITDRNLNDLIWIINKWATKIPIEIENKELMNIQLAQLAFIYAMVISISFCSKHPIKILKELKPYSYLLKYDINPKVKIVRRTIETIGLYPSYMLMYLRNKWKNRGI